MKIPRCATPDMMKRAKNMVKAGLENQGLTTYAWVETWKVALYWLKAPTFCALAYYSEGPFDDSMQMQILDAFSRSSGKSLVTIVNETDTSAVCFFGGVPSNVQLATLDFKAMDITKMKSI